MDLLTTYTHDSEPEIIASPPLLSTIHKSPQHPLSLFQPVVSSPTVPWLRLLTVKILQLHAFRSYLHSLPYRTAYQLTTDLVAPIVLKIILRHGLRRKHYSCMLAVSAGMCARHPATGCVTPSNKNPMPKQRESFRYRHPSMGLHATISSAVDRTNPLSDFLELIP
jgi:hypothetical protein